MSLKYKDAGVDVEAGYESVKLMKDAVKSTFSKDVLSAIGGFGGLFSIAKAKDMVDPVLVSGTDGVGTKLKMAFLMDKHDTIGIDCVAMCVNDIICSGAEPLFFLDYIACGKNFPQKIATIVKGVADGCNMSNCALIGGETAEMPGFYPINEYDLAGFSVGILDKSKIIDGSKIKKGDIVIAISSSGLHSNGYSLVRKVFNPSEENFDKDFNIHIDKLGCTLGEELLKPTKIYVKSILDLIKHVEVKGISNITGGGFYENIPRCLPDGFGVNIKLGSWNMLPIFNMIQEKGNISEKDMYNTFNMSVGMILVVSKEDVDKTIKKLEENGENAYEIGYITEGNGVTLC